MRCECVKWMDFKSRMGLRGASKTEKFLLESTPKYHFDSVKIDLAIDYQPRVVCKEGSVEIVMIKGGVGKMSRESNEKTCYLITQLLKFAVIDHLELRENFADCSILFKTVINSPFRFRKLSLKCQNTPLVGFLLKNCVGVEKIELECWDELDLACYPSVIAARKIKMPILTRSPFPSQMMQKWIEKDVEIGTKMKLRTVDPNCLGLLFSQFETRAIYSSDTELRLRMDNNSKCIQIKKPREHWRPDEITYTFIVKQV